MPGQALDSTLSRTLGQALAAALALGSVAVLVETGAIHSAEIGRAGALASEPADSARADAAVLASYSFSLSATLPLDGVQARCGDDAPRGEAASKSGGRFDRSSFDINCVAASTAKAAGGSRAQLLSSPGDSRYDRPLRF